MPRFDRADLQHALEWEEAYGDPAECPKERSRRIVHHLKERPTYYREMAAHLPAPMGKSTAYAATPFNLRGVDGSSTVEHQRLPDRDIWAPPEEKEKDIRAKAVKDSENRKQTNLVFTLEGFDGQAHAEPTLRYYSDEALRVFFEQEDPDLGGDKLMQEALLESRERLVAQGKAFREQSRDRSRFFQGADTVKPGRKVQKALVFVKG